ncbi:MAG: hypothetical protein K6G08_07465 [Prevotella sp.]|nr:hypothetical protein [Prevotella sp.]
MIDYESPLFISIQLYAMYALLLAAAGLTVWSLVRSARMLGGSRQTDNGIPVRRIAWLSVLLLVLTLLLTWLLADTTPLTINSKTYADVFWLRVSDMLINTSLILIIVAAAGTVWGVVRSRIIRS